MLFKQKITLNVNTLDDFGEPSPSVSHELRCNILESRRKKNRNANGTTVHKTLIIVAPYRDFQPYYLPATNDKVTLTYAGIEYGIDGMVIGDVNGKPSFYELRLLEETNAA